MISPQYLSQCGASSMPKSAIVLVPIRQSKHFEEIVAGGSYYNYLTAANYAQSKIR